MKGRKERLAEAMFRFKILDLYRPFPGRQLVVFGYHRVWPEGPAAKTPFDDDVFGPTVSGLAAQLTWLQKHSRILSQAELIDSVRSGRLPAARCTAITFDDGYRDNYDLVYPLLKRLGVPAIFFITTDMVESRRLAWWDIIAYIIKKTRLPRFTFLDEAVLVENNIRGAINQMLDRMKLEPTELTAGLVASLAECCQVDLPGAELEDGEIMTWEQIKEISRSGLDIGSHTHTHRVLATLDSTDQREELSRSKAILESKLDRPVTALAYPVGGYEHFTRESRRIAKACGYRLAFSYITGYNRQSELEPYDVRRLEGPLELSMLAGLTKMPGLFT